MTPEHHSSPSNATLAQFVATRLVVTLSVLFSLGCASAPSALQVQWQSAAEEDRAGRHAQAALEWQEASRLATRARDRDEALYRAGSAFTRAGKLSLAEGLFVELMNATPAGERAPRACLDAAQLARRRGDPRTEITRLESCVTRFPESGVGPGVVRDLVFAVRDAEGEAGVAAHLTQLKLRVKPGKLDEALRFERAESLLRQSREDEALTEFQAMVATYRYPIGALWDDGLWEISLIEARRGRTREAIRLLEQMLGRREESHLAGSYERPRFAKARYKIAELIWNAERDPARASLEFERVWHDHRTHLLADDGLWQAARAAAAAGDAQRACTLAQRLRDESPDEPSRYVGCETLICPGIEPSARNCRSYLRAAHLEDPTRAPALE